MLKKRKKKKQSEETKKVSEPDSDMSDFEIIREFEITIINMLWL